MGIALFIVGLAWMFIALCMVWDSVNFGELGISALNTGLAAALMYWSLHL